MENEELVALAQARAEAEESYGLRLQELARVATRRGGFTRDDGASARKAFDGMRKEMEEVPSPETPYIELSRRARIMSKLRRICMPWSFDLSDAGRQTI